MTKSKSKIPCKCGHSRINHLILPQDIIYVPCAVWTCECEDYKPDNLKYLENEYEQKSR
jgi:hypothetical protein